MPFFKYHIDVRDIRREYRAGVILPAQFARAMYLQWPKMAIEAHEQPLKAIIQGFHDLADNPNASAAALEEIWNQFLGWADTAWGDDTKMCEVRS